MLKFVQTIPLKETDPGYDIVRDTALSLERFRDVPAKNAASHPHDALQYVAMESGGVQATMPKGQQTRRQAPAHQITDRATGVLG